MKKIVLSLCILIFACNVKAQDVKRTFGIGFQSSLPVYGLSVKYALNTNSVVQATIAPFASGDFKLNFYGGRYLYRFISDESNKLDPYVYGGVGLISYTTPSYDMNTGAITNKSNSFFSYSAGGGVEYSIAGALGLSLELGYGKLNVTNGDGVSGVFFGGGIHYYIK